MDRPGAVPAGVGSVVMQWDILATYLNVQSKAATEESADGGDWTVASIVVAAFLIVGLAWVMMRRRARAGRGRVTATGCCGGSSLES